MKSFLNYLLPFFFAGILFSGNLFAQQSNQEENEQKATELSVETLSQMSRADVRSLPQNVVAEIARVYPGAVYEEYVQVPRKVGTPKSSRRLQKVKRVDYERLTFLLFLEQQKQKGNSYGQSDLSNR